MSDCNVFSINYDNAQVICLNCANIMWLPLNVKGEGGVTCPKCKCYSKVKAYRRKFSVTLFPPREEYAYADEYFEDFA